MPHQDQDDRLPELSISLRPGGDIPRDLERHADRFLKNLTLTVKTASGTEIDIPLDEILMGTRRPVRRQTAGNAKYALCGNCGEKLPLTGDAEIDHHTAQRHKVEACGKTAQAQDEWRQLTAENQEETARRQLAAAQQPRLNAAPKPKHWWNRWF